MFGVIGLGREDGPEGLLASASPPGPGLGVRRRRRGRHPPPDPRPAGPDGRARVYARVVGRDGSVEGAAGDRSNRRGSVRAES